MSIVLREVDDWIAVYKDGEKVWENHSCRLADGLEALGIDFTHERLDEEPKFNWNADNLTISVSGRNRVEDAFPERLP